MSQDNQYYGYNEQADTEQSAVKTGRKRKSLYAGIAAVVVGGLLMAQHVTPASAAPEDEPPEDAVVAPVPAPGFTWVQGILTDQAGHALDNVNVEAWSTDPSAVEPVGSNLTYAGAPADARHQHGVFRVEVPSNQPYKILFSVVGGQEDGDRYRMQAYGEGRPLLLRAAGTAQNSTLKAVNLTAGAVTSGRVIDLGTTQLARQGLVASATKAKLAKARIKRGHRGSVRVTVSSPYVTNVTGRVLVKVGRKTMHRTLYDFSHGTVSVRLPKLSAGKHAVRVSFQGSDTVSASGGRAVLTVRK